MKLKKDTISEIKIGIIVIFAFAIFIWGLNFLKGVNLFNPQNYFVVSFEKVDGLVKSSPVMLDGFQVGLVRDIQYQYNKPGTILVYLDLNRKLNLPIGSQVILKSALIGTPGIELKLGNNSNSFIGSDDTIIGIKEDGLMDQLSNGLLASVESLVARADSLISGIEVTIENGNLENSLASLEMTSKNLELISGKLNKTIDKDLPVLLENINTLSGEFSDVGRNINQLDLKGTLKRFDLVMDQMGDISLKLNSSDNSLGLLLNDKSLYNNLSSTAQSANMLLLNLKEEPARYVHFSIFGKSKK
jgi:phospholipid/cholesterol/gamma-HCH transport system substrate-binding protein